MATRTKEQPKPLVSRTWQTVHGASSAVLFSKDGRSGVLQVTLPGTRTPETRYHARTAEAVEELKAKADPAATDFGGERDFADWLLFVFTSRGDVQMMD